MEVYDYYIHVQFDIESSWTICRVICIIKKCELLQNGSLRSEVIIYLL